MESIRLKTKLLRLWKIEELLITRNGLTMIELSELLKVNRRTIYRDMNLLQEVGVPIINEDGLYKIMATYKVPNYRPCLLAKLDDPGKCSLGYDMKG